MHHRVPKMEPTSLAKPRSSSSSSSRRAALKGTSRPASNTNTFQDLQASLVRAGMRRAGMSASSAAACFKAEPTSSVGCSGSGYPYVPSAAVSKQGRISHAPSEASRKSGRAAASTRAAAVVPAKWVWGQGQEEEEEEDEEEVEEAQHHRQTLAPVAHDLGGDAASKQAQPEHINVFRKKMFADSSSSSFESSCSTEAMTESTTSSPKDANWDAPFLSRLSDMSMMFPEPPTRPPGETTPSSSSRALTISGLGKNITSSLPSVQLLIPLRWRKRLRATGSNKRCRKSTSRWIARSKATSSMSEKSLLARALSINDNGPNRGKEAAAAGAKPKPSSSSRTVESTAVMTPPRRRGVSKVAGETPPQLSMLAEVNEQQEEEERQEEEEEDGEAHPACDPPSALPTPVPHPAEKSPPPAPLHTAPRPPAPQKQRYNVAALLSARHSSRLRRRDCFASSPSAAGTEDTCFASSPSLSPPYMTVKNRLASSSSSIFEEDGDDNKKTLFLNPYSRSPLPQAAVAPRTCAAPAAKATAAKKKKPDATTHDPSSSSDSWVWGGRSSNNPTNKQQQQQRHSLFATGAAVDGARRRAAVAALQVEANRQYGDRRRRMKDGESGIWLPSPGIWSSARRPTPLNADLFSAW
ncbi:unnamed protein product [Ectocarpus sp. 4 AP-2014]